MFVCTLSLGCARTIINNSAAEHWATSNAPGDAGAGGGGDLDFWDQLETQRVVTNNDALHGLILLADGADPSRDYQARLEVARQRGWLNQSAQLQPHESARIGDVAVAVCHIMNVRGGLTLRLLGPSPRYCTRELVAQQLIPPRSEHQAITGLEFIDLMGRVEDKLGRSSDPTRASMPEMPALPEKSS